MSASDSPESAQGTQAEPLWAAEDVARFLKMSKSWVYHASQRGELPHVRIGASLRFDPSSIRAWLRRRSNPEAAVLPFKTDSGLTEESQ